MGKIHFALICLAYEIIRFFRPKFLVSPAEKTRNMSRKPQALPYFVELRVMIVVRPSL